MTPERPDLSGLHIVVVDDNADAREILGSYLEHIGAAVTLVSSATDALVKLAEIRAHVVISDISMPGLDGIAFLRELRARPHEREKPTYAIAFSGYTTTAHRAEALAAGYDAFVSKPADPLEIATRIAQRFAERRGGPRRTSDGIRR